MRGKGHHVSMIEAQRTGLPLSQLLCLYHKCLKMDTKLNGWCDDIEGQPKSKSKSNERKPSI